MDGDQASVDSELTLLYADMKRRRRIRSPARSQSVFWANDRAFAHPEFPMYLVTRLAAYDFDGVKASSTGRCRPPIGANL